MRHAGLRLFAALAPLVLLLSGCTRNAIFELELELPEQPAGASLFAVVSARAGAGFDQSWDDVPSVAVALPESCVRAEELSCSDRVIDPACRAVVSVVGDGSDTDELFVRVRFCADPDCVAGESAPEHRLLIDRAFYLGRYTQVRTCIESLPESSDPLPEVIERCAVRCREGSGTHHCREDGSHFCEPERAL